MQGMTLTYGRVMTEDVMMMRTQWQLWSLLPKTLHRRQLVSRLRKHCL